MKVLLDIQDNKATHLLEVLKGLSLVKTRTISNEKAILMEEVKEAVENLALVRGGKLEVKPQENFIMSYDALLMPPNVIKLSFFYLHAVISRYEKSHK